MRTIAVFCGIRYLKAEMNGFYVLLIVACVLADITDVWT